MTARFARCTLCGTEQPSSPTLPFFEDCGPGSRDASRCAHDGYLESAHRISPRPHHLRHLCDHYEPRGDCGVDQFYCGCQGWE